MYCATFPVCGKGICALANKHASNRPDKRFFFIHIDVTVRKQLEKEQGKELM
jgi:hypothetical protein